MKKQKYTFKQWCLDNNRYDLLDRWDYNKTGFGPDDITYSSSKDVYFKCPNGIHESSKRKVYHITSPSSDQKDFKCNGCLNGHAQNFEDLTGKVFGDLTVLRLDTERNKNSNRKQTYWLCQCSCGKTISTYASALKRGDQKTCGDRSIHNCGENNSNWKGGVTSQLLCERTSKEYNEWRDSTYAKDYYTCQCCGAYGSNVEKNAHHIENFSDNKDLRYSIDNSITLCAECHHIKYSGSFHNIYGTRHNNEYQLEEYINNKRKELGMNIPFSIDKYKNGEILTKDKVNNYYESVFDLSAGRQMIKIDKEIKISNFNKNFINIKPRFRIKEECNYG